MVAVMVGGVHRRDRTPLPSQPVASVRPGTSIVTGPAATVAGARAAFTFAGVAGDNGVSTFRCRELR
jgi:hypothetical protein